MVILNWIVRHMQAKSWAAYRALRRVHYAVCITGTLEVVQSQIWASKIFDRHLTPVVKYSETQAERTKSLFFFSVSLLISLLHY